MKITIKIKSDGLPAVDMGVGGFRFEYEGGTA
jgi:hypothetical protein